MHRYTGYLRYTTDNSGRRGQDVHVELLVQFFPGQFTIVVTDVNARTKHEISNRRFNYQSRDSPNDLLARDKWRSNWFGRFSGAVYLNFPQVHHVPRELSIRAICSWEPAFGVVEFKVNDTFYQLARRPRRGANCWTRRDFQCEDEYEPNRIHEPASSSNAPPEEPANDASSAREEETPVLASPSPKGGSI